MRSVALGLAALIATLSSPINAQQLWVTMDQVRSYSVDKPADSIIVGNPGIADIAVQDENRFLLFGKAPGLTNIIVLDNSGETIENLTVRVNPPSSSMLVYHRGPQRTTYNCTSHCEATLTIGDNNTDFVAINQQIQTKLGQQASGSAPQDLQEGDKGGL